MAINVNTVYQTVLLILNKEQRGYMTPLEINKIGKQSINSLSSESPSNFDKNIVLS